MEFRLDLNVIKAEEHQSQFALVLHNLSEKVIENWTLHFTVTRYITPESVTYGDLSQTGTLCRYTTGEALQPNSHVYVEFSHKTKPFTFFDEGITEACLHISQGENIEIFAVETTPVDLAMATPARTSLILPAPHQINLIPQPKAMVQTTGFFAFDDHCAIVACEESKAAATWLMEEINTHLNQNYIIKREGNILFRLDENLPLSGYRLSVQVEKIILTAASSQGFVHGVSSILQLVPPNPSHRHTSAYQVPCVEIEDTPRFKYRGMMLDCARHFHPISRIKSLINQLARYKFNFFQWHLTDDEGWRIEIDAYPELTEIGAWRGPFETLEPQYTNLTNIHGGFYKKSEIRDVIEYAEQRGITVIPEIDIPGHCRAAIKSLPDLLIENNDLSEYRSIQHFSDNVLNPGIKGTYQFLENVLNEVCELFPSSYIHIGADEVPEGVWEKSPACQKLMYEHNYVSYKDLQGHLLRHVEDFLKTRTKKMLGWEEVVFGEKVSKDSIIFSWISEQSAFENIKNGYRVVLQPGQHTYLDMVQDFSADEPGTDWAIKLPLEQVYQYEPLTGKSLSPREFEQILGIQCALWSELTNNQSRFDYMIYPRLLAVAEVCWSGKEQRDWPDFQARLSGQLQYLDRLGINYRR